LPEPGLLEVLFDRLVAARLVTVKPPSGRTTTPASGRAASVLITSSLDRQIGRLAAAEYLGDIRGGAAVHREKIDPIATARL
jgi:hypothetical protein